MDIIKGDCTKEIIGSAFEVFNTLGYGYSEKEYQNALKLELESRGFKVSKEGSIVIEYKGTPIKNRRFDLLVNNCVVVEIKVGVRHYDAHKIQLLTYMKAMDKELGLLIYFNNGGVEPKRVINSFDKSKKNGYPV